MAKKLMTKERYMELKEIAKKVIIQLGPIPTLNETTCKNIVDNIKTLENEEEKMIIINNLFFPDDEDFIKRLHSFKNNINATAKFYNCSSSLVMRKKAELEFYYYFFGNSIFPDKEEIVAPKQNNSDEVLTFENSDSIEDLRLKINEYSKLLEIYEKTTKENKDRIEELVEENRILKKAVLESQCYLKDTLDFLDSFGKGRR